MHPVSMASLVFLAFIDHWQVQIINDLRLRNENYDRSNIAGTKKVRYILDRFERFLDKLKSTSSKLESKLHNSVFLGKWQFQQFLNLNSLGWISGRGIPKLLPSKFGWDQQIQDISSQHETTSLLFAWQNTKTTLQKQVVLGTILGPKYQELHITKLLYKLQTNMAPQNIQNSLEKEIPIENHQFFWDPMFVFRGEFLGVQNCTSVIVFGSTLVAFHTSKQVSDEGQKSSSHQPAGRPAEKVGLDMLNMSSFPARVTLILIDRILVQLRF